MAKSQPFSGNSKFHLNFPLTHWAESKPAHFYMPALAHTSAPAIALADTLSPRVRRLRLPRARLRLPVFQRRSTACPWFAMHSRLTCSCCLYLLLAHASIPLALPFPTRMERPEQAYEFLAVAVFSRREYHALLVAT